MKNWIVNRDKYIMEPYLNMVESAVDDFIKSNKRKPILLEVGCGRGQNLQQRQKDIFKKCKKVIGIDPDEIALGENIIADEKYVAFLDKIPIDNESVDIIISAWVLEHISDPVFSIKELSRVLRKNGSVIFITPNKNSLPGVINRLVPNSLHPIICKVVYRRNEDDTYRTEYKMNALKDLDASFEDGHFEKKKFVFHDDLKFLGSFILLRPFAWLWNIIIMQELFKQFRAIIVAQYIKY